MNNHNIKAASWPRANYRQSNSICQTHVATELCLICCLFDRLSIRLSVLAEFSAVIHFMIFHWQKIQVKIYLHPGPWGPPVTRPNIAGPCKCMWCYIGTQLVRTQIWFLTFCVNKIIFFRSLLESSSHERYVNDYHSVTGGSLGRAHLLGIEIISTYCKFPELCWF